MPPKARLTPKTQHPIESIDSNSGQWERWFNVLNFPSLAWAFGIFTVMMVVMYSAHPIDDPDIWWHMKTGQWISQHGQVPKADPFSYAIEGKPWIAHEWLAQCVFWKFWEGSGPAGLFFFREAWAALLFGMLFTWGMAVPLAASALLLFGYSFAGYGIVERPWIFSFFFTLAYRFFIPRYAADAPGAWRWALSAVVLHALWTNFHGGASAVGLIIVGVYLTAYAGFRQWPQAKRLAVLFLLMLLASFLNPRGWKVYLRLFGELFDPMHQWITEKNPLTPASVHFWPYLVYFAALTAVLVKEFRGPERAASLVLAAGFGGFFAFSSVRNVPWAFFITFPDLLQGVSRFLSARPRLGAYLAVPLFFFVVHGHRWLLAATHETKEPNPITQEWSKGACDFILREKFQGRMYNDYVNGGYLIWRVTPRHKVFVDGRGLEYGEQLMQKLFWVSTQQGFEDLDGSYRFDFSVFLQRKDSRLLYLDRHPDWRCVYFDDGALIYVHKDRASRALTPRFAFRYLSPNEENFGYLLAYARDPALAREVMAELDRAIRQSPPDLAINAHLIKSFFIQASQGPEAWARWAGENRARFDHPIWRRQFE